MATRTFVKICGITRPEDAVAAVRAGADAVGFVFAPSPRRVSPSQAARIGCGLGTSVRKVGVFVNESAGNVVSIVEEAGLDGVQLHGSEGEEVVGKLRAHRRSLLIFKVVKSAAADELAKAEGLDVDAVFIDPKRTDDPLAPVESISMDSLRGFSGRFVVAGGLTSSNVGRLVAEVRPWGVDVSGGVEAEPGKKDHEKVAAFVRAVRLAEQSA